MVKTNNTIKQQKKLEEQKQILIEDSIVTYGETLLKYQQKKELYLKKGVQCNQVM